MRGMCNRSAVVIGLATSMTAAGPDVIEGLVDAGDSIATAMDTTVLFAGQPTSIAGRLNGTDASPVDFVDMYLITITAPTAFAAETIFLSPPPGEPRTASFDTQLWLFDASGLGLLANDDKSGVDLGSLITPPANDGTGAVIPGAGTYLLAISVSGVTPISAGGSIFDLTDPPGVTQVSGPDGAGGASPLTAWDTTSPAVSVPGDYIIRITPSPGTATTVAVLAICGARRRRL